MFNRDFFSGEFREKVRKFSAEHNAGPVRVCFSRCLGANLTYSDTRRVGLG